MSANDTQVAGTHYRTAIQHWDYVIANDMDYFQGQITKYVTRWKKKNGIQDLKKAQHFLAKYIEAVESGVTFTNAAVEVPVTIEMPATAVEAAAKEVAHYEISQLFETEGFVGTQDWWRCKQCRERFCVPIGVNPAETHRCSPEEPTGGGYVGQGRD